MEEQNIFDQEMPEQEEKVYHPRPAYQIWLARIGVVIMILAFLAYCYQIATGGM